LPKLKENFNKSLKNLRKMVCWTLEVVLSPSFQVGGWGPGLRASGRDWPEAHPDKSWKPSKKPADQKSHSSIFFLPQKNIYQTYVYIYNYIYYIELAFCSRHRVKRASLPRKNTASDPFQVVKMGLSEHAAYSYSKVIFFWEPLTIKHWIWMDSGSETPRNARMEPSHVQIQD